MQAQLLHPVQFPNIIYILDKKNKTNRRKDSTRYTLGNSLFLYNECTNKTSISLNHSIFISIVLD